MNKIYFVEVTTTFKNGTSNLPYRLVAKYKSIKGALKAGERHAAFPFYENVSMHRVVVKNGLGNYVTSMAC